MPDTSINATTYTEDGLRERIVRLRRRMGYNQAALARMLGLNRTTYAYRESHSTFTPEMLLRLSEILEVSLDELMIKDAAKKSPTPLPAPPEPDNPNILRDSVNEFFLDGTEKALIKTMRVLSANNRKAAIAYVNDLYHSQQKKTKIEDLF